MNPQEKSFFADHLDRIKEKKRRFLEDDVDDIPSGIACKKCQKKTVRYVLIQTRSADESSSAFFRCKTCDFKWGYR